MAPLEWRGTVEGFYGTPWSHQARSAHLEFSAEVGLNTYVYAPKDDPYHRDRWREPYPAAELGRLAELAATARRLGVRFVYAISPALSMRFAEDAEHAALAAKAGQLHDAGVTSFGLFFDDVPDHDGAAHGLTCTRFVEDFLVPHGIEGRLLVCPTDYAGTDPSPYRAEFARTAPADVLITWTGADIVVGAVTGEQLDRAAASYRRPLVLWDNFPVNDFDPTRVFLGPLVDRAGHGERAVLRGILANPMSLAVASRLAVATVADWARDPDGYHPPSAAAAALDRVAGPGAPPLAPLVRACGAWPPSADQDPELSTATRDALAGARTAVDLVASRLTELADGCRAAVEPAPLVAELRPWLASGIATAEAGLAAVRLLRASLDGGSADDITRLRARARVALDAAEVHYQGVLRPIVPPFVRAVLARTAPPEPAGRPVAVLVTGPEPLPGDQAVVDLLAGRGFAVRRTDSPTAGTTGDAALVVVTSGAAPAAIGAVARVEVPLLAWQATADLGLATARRPALCDGRAEIVRPDDPLAAGRTGQVSLLRGPAWLSVAEVDAAHVVVRAADGGAALVFRYAAGDRLADGTTAPAPRIGLFLGNDGPARWLLTEDGQALVAAAVDAAVRREVSA